LGRAARVLKEGERETSSHRDGGAPSPSRVQEQGTGGPARPVGQWDSRPLKALMAVSAMSSLPPPQIPTNQQPPPPSPLPSKRRRSSRGGVFFPSRLKHEACRRCRRSYPAKEAAAFALPSPSPRRSSKGDAGCFTKRDFFASLTRWRQKRHEPSDAHHAEHRIFAIVDK